ncbi:hypothetical protein [Dactylosporangium sp. CA-139066]|uniref:hypothetical protein n=1 Tax=Dactylosporangium sp. CA-139066 TaxID=3239930 RepID=UPI003D9115C0
MTKDTNVTTTTPIPGRRHGTETRHLLRRRPPSTQHTTRGNLHDDHASGDAPTGAFPGISVAEREP